MPIEEAQFTYLKLVKFVAVDTYILCSGPIIQCSPNLGNLQTLPLRSENLSQNKTNEIK